MALADAAGCESVVMQACDPRLDVGGSQSADAPLANAGRTCTRRMLRYRAAVDSLR